MIVILYVDDEPGLLEIGKLFLERSGQFSVDISTSAPEALAMLGSKHYDAIISDYHMPVMDGIEFLKKVRASGNSVPFIMLTGRGREEIVIQALNEGADFYLQKGGKLVSQFTELAHQIRHAVQQRWADASIYDFERRESDIINFLPDATFVIDRSGRIIAWNHAIEEMTGVFASEMLGKGEHEYAIPFYGARQPILIDLIFEPDEVIARKYAHILHKNHTLMADTNLVFPNGTPATLMVMASPLYNQQGDVVGAIESIRDITDRKRAADAVTDANKKLKLLTGITRHDITNQLTIMMGNLSFLEEMLPDNSAGEYFRRINGSAERILSIIRFTGEYEEIGANVPAWQNCRALIDAAAKQVHPGEILIKNDLPAGTEMFADPMIVKVFYNLMDNAIRYGGKITALRFFSEEQNGKNILVCEDDGTGIPLADKKKIFKRGVGKNTGLGLFLAREILSITGITIQETGKPGEGARFEITLPEGTYRNSGVPQKRS
jgi:signal transduction histidine kinase